MHNDRELPAPVASGPQLLDQVRDGKGAKDRVTILPEGLIEPLKQWLVRVKALHEKDLADGYGKVRV